MSASEYGLSIVLDFEDNATAGMQKAASTFSSLSGSADRLSMGIGGTADSLLDMNTSIVGMSVLGSQFQNTGKNMLGVLGTIGGEVMNTGSIFENFGMTLNSLYKDSEVASGVISDLFDYAVKSPYEVKDLTGMVVTLKSQGLEAFDEVTNAITGARQETLSWIGDLQAFRPEATATQWKLAIQNFLSGTNNQSATRLRNILDIGDLSQFIGHDLGKTVEARMQSLTDIVEKLGMTGLQDNLSKTWSTTLSNMSDAWTQFAYRIGFGNKDSNMYIRATSALHNLLEALSSEGNLLNNEDIIDGVAESFDNLLKPVEGLTEWIAKLSPMFSEWLGNHPKVLQFATAFTAVGGAGIYATGSILKLSSSVANWMLNVQRLGGLSGMIGLLGNSFKALSFKMLGVGSVVALSYLAWKNNVLGIRDVLTSAGSQISTLVQNINEGLSEGKTVTQVLNENGLQKFTEGFSDLKSTAKSALSTVYNGFSEFFGIFGVNLPKFDKDSFNLTSMLNGMGESLSNTFGKDSDFVKNHGDTLKSIGNIVGGFTGALAATTLASGGVKILTGAVSSLGTNLAVIGKTIMSPFGLIGVGSAVAFAAYKNNFLGLHDAVAPKIDSLKQKYDSFVNTYDTKHKDGEKNIFTAATGFTEQSVKNLASKFTDAFSTGRDIVENGFNIKTAGNNFRDKSRFSNMVDRKNLESFFDFFDNRMHYASLMAKNFGEGLIKPFKNIKDIFADIFNLDSLGPFNSDTVLKAMDRIGGKLREWSDKYKIAGGLDTFLGMGSFNVGNVLSKVAIVTAAFMGLKTLLGSLGINWSPVTSGLDMIRSGLNTIRASAVTTVSALTTGFRGAKTAMASVGTNFLSMGRSLLGANWELFANTRGTLSRSLDGNIQQARSTIRTGFSRLGASVSTGISGVTSKLSKSWGKIKDVPVVPAIASSVSSVAGKISKPFKSVASVVSDFAKSYDHAVRVAKSGGKQFTVMGRTMRDLAKQHPGIAKLSNSIKSLPSNISSGLNKLKAMPSNIANGFKNLGTSVKNAMSTIGNSTTSALSKLRTGLMNFKLSDIFNTRGLRSIGQRMADSLFEPIIEEKDGVTEVLQSTMDQFKSTLAGGFKTGLQFGGNIISAVAQTAFAYQSAVWQAQFSAIQTGISTFARATMGAMQLTAGLYKTAIGFSLLTSAVLTFGTLTTSSWTELRNRVAEQPTLIGKASAAYDWFNEKLAGTTERVADFVAKFDVSSFVGKIGSIGGKLAESLASILGGTDGSSGIADLGGRILDSLLKGLVTATDSGGNLRSAMQKIFDSINNAIMTYTPSMTKNVADVLSNVFDFASYNSGDFIESALSIMDNFMQALVSNSDQIVPAALRIVRNFSSSIKAHAPQIIDSAHYLISEFISGIESGEGGDVVGAIQSVIEPIIQFVSEMTPRIQALAKEAFGGLIDSIVVMVGEGIDKMGEMMQTALNWVAGISTAAGAILGALSLIPGMQFLAPVATGLIGVGVSTGAASLGIEGLQQVLGKYTEEAKANIEVSKQTRKELANQEIALTKVRKSYESMGEGEEITYEITAKGNFIEFKNSLEELSPKKLEDMYRNNEIIIKARMTAEGIEETKLKVDKVFNENTGEYEYKLVVMEDEPTAESIVDDNKAYGESNPVKQEVQAEGGDGGYITDEDVAYKESQDAARSRFYGTNFVKDSNNSIYEGIKGSYSGTLGYSSSMFSQFIRSNNEFSKMKSSSYSDWKSVADVIGGVQGKIQELSKTEHKFTTDQEKALKDLASFNWDSLVAHNGDGSIAVEETASNIQKKVEEINTLKDSLSQGVVLEVECNAEGLQEVVGYWDTIDGKSIFIPIEIQEDGSVNALREVKEIDGKKVVVEIQEDGSEKILGTLEELDGKKAVVEVSEEGAEGTMESINNVTEAAAEADGSEVNVTVNEEKNETTTKTENVEITADATTLEEAQTNIEEIKKLLDGFGTISNQVKVSLEIPNLAETASGLNELKNALTGMPENLDRTYNIQLNGNITSLKTEIPSMLTTLVSALSSLPESLSREYSITLNSSGLKTTAVSAITLLSSSLPSLPASGSWNYSLSLQATGMEKASAVKEATKSAQGFMGLNSHSVSYAMNLGGSSAAEVNAAVAAGRSFQSLTDHTVTYTTVYRTEGSPGKAPGENAYGTNDWSGGLSWVHERGPELINLPSGTQIIPHEKSMDARYDMGYNAGLLDGQPDYSDLMSPMANLMTTTVVNNSKETDNSHIDNSVHFNDGSIQIKVDNAKGDIDYRVAADKIWYYISQKQNRDKMARR